MDIKKYRQIYNFWPTLNKFLKEQDEAQPTEEIIDLDAEEHDSMSDPPKAKKAKLNQLKCPDILIPSIIHENLDDFVEYDRKMAAYTQMIFSCDSFKIFSEIFDGNSRSDSVETKSEIVPENNKVNFGIAHPEEQIRLVIQDLKLSTTSSGFKRPSHPSGINSSVHHNFSQNLNTFSASPKIFIQPMFINKISIILSCLIYNSKINKKILMENLLNLPEVYPKTLMIVKHVLVNLICIFKHKLFAVGSSMVVKTRSPANRSENQPAALNPSQSP